VKGSGAPSIGDIVEVTHDTRRTGFVVGMRGIQIGIRYFKPYMVRGTPVDFVWWIHRQHVKVVSAAPEKI
jgi:hypothetical protein